VGLLINLSPSSQARTKEVEELLQDNCDVIHMRIHPSMVPFLTPMKQIETNLGAYIAPVPVNHNKINTGIAFNITSTMMGGFAQDDDKDASQLQEMGSDAGVVFGYNKKHVRT